MMLRIKPHARRACMFGGLLAVLMGCNNSGAPFSKQESTFEEVQSAGPVIDPVVDVKPVVGTVIAVAGTDTKTPVTGGGNATSLIKNDNQIVLPVPAKVGRFTEIAPDTIGGATFRSKGAYEYDLGNLVAKSSEDLIASSGDHVFITPIKGWVRFPQEAIGLTAAPGRFPLVVFEHGMGAELSYKGYDYLAEDLATHGYVVISINADASNNVSDWLSQSRAQLILGTLDRLREIDKNGQIDENGNPGALNSLQGKLDFTRIGIMGHSRGGQGVSNTIKFNQTRYGLSELDLKAALIASPYTFENKYPDLAASVIPAIEAQPAIEAVEGKQAIAAMKGRPAEPAVEAIQAQPAIEAVEASIDDTTFQAAIQEYNIFYAAGRETSPPYDFKGAFMLAPMDSSSNLGVNNVPLANLLPSCDGDVANLDGALVFDHNRFGPTTDTAPRYQVLVHGANHDFYNTVWGDDGEWSNPDYCDDDRTDSIRLSREDQERNGLFIIDSFMRYHVGGEQKFAAYWNGTARMPDAACASGQGPCDERVVLTVQKNANRRKLIQRFEHSNSIERNLLDGAFALSGFDTTAHCAMAFSDRTAAGECTPARLEGFEYKTIRGIGLKSNSDHVELAWSKPNAAIVTDLKGISAKGLDSLTFRIAVVRPMGQEVLVTLSDSAGKTATVTASDFSNALYNAPRKNGDGRPLADHPDDWRWEDKVAQLMNMVAIPLKAFEGVDMTSLKELKLVFPKESGKVAITDIELQNLGREKAEKTVAAEQ